MKNHITTILFIFLTYPIFAKTSITGRLDADISSDGKVYLEVHTNYLSKFNSFYSLNLSDTIDSKGRFHFEVEDPAAYYYIKVYYEGDSGLRIELAHFRGNLLLIAKDSKLYLNVTNRGIILSNINEDLYLFQHKLHQIDTKKGAKTNTTEADYNKEISELEVCLREIDFLAQAYKERLPKIAELLAFDYKCFKIWGLMNSMSYKAYDKQGVRLNDFAVNTVEKIMHLADEYCSDNWDTKLLYNYVHLRYLIELEKAGLMSGVTKDKVDVKLFHNLKQSYNGYLLDQLLTTFYLDYLVIYNSLAVREPDSIFKLLKAEELLNIAKLSHDNNEKGRPVYPIVLKDALGNSVPLSDLKGKVMLVEFWYKGCRACIDLSKALEKELACYDKKDKLLHVTVNVDRTFDKFIEGVKSGQYTSDGTLDLWIGQDGYQHEMLSKYNYYGYPQLMLVDKDGNLVTAFLPKPTIVGRTKEFFEVLNSIL
ncbi:TlpA family protein disulfide reductase [Sphingobacterium paucimobilis]|uniref:Thioredoxin domain-containing protein n=1 Tax=Sphingobacterium paucimobilis HER1398 TaxID=1346330 RepID=U2HU51_9SPHI|nr:TlpA disulfide reductase family protein [Sphingobacterium paucimobilis]ERJ58810.1 hypothetical protein M472_08515 [Sphingobacterium paucimobilis HER1398]